MELAKSDSRLYRSVDRHLRRTREILDKEDNGSGQVDQDAKRLLNDSHELPSRLLKCEPSFERQPRVCLQDLCKKYGIRGYSRMKKSDLIAALKAKGVAAPAVPMQAFSKAELLALIEYLTCN